MVEMPWRKTGENTRSYGPLLFFVLIGAFLVLYLFSDALQEQGIPTDIPTIVFLVLVGIALWAMAFLVSMLSPDRPKLDVSDWVIIIIAGAAIVVLMVAFPGIVPANFKSSIVNIQSFLGM